MSFAVQMDPIDVARETQNLMCEAQAAGAVVTFLGLVRDLPNQPLKELFLEHYPGMTENAMKRLEDEARGRWPLQGVRMVHRYGSLHPHEVIVFVGVASEHRADAFKGCEFLMDALKSNVPFWKKEVSATGGAWVAERDSDHQAMERWTTQS